MSKKTAAEPLEEQPELIEIRIRSDLRKRPYGLLARAGISTSGMTPREAWAAWNEYRKEERKKSKKAKKRDKKQRKALAQERKRSERAASAAPEKALPSASAPVPQLPAPKPLAEIRATTPAASFEIPALNANKIAASNSNSMFNRGSVIERDYQDYVNQIMSWDISYGKKAKLIAELHKRFEEKLAADARFVPWTVSGPARYPSRKMNARAESSLRKSAEISDWFEGVEKSVQNSKRQYAEDDRKRKADWEERRFQRSIENGWYKRGGQLNATLVANGLAPIAQYDPDRFVELYEQWDKDLHFRKNTTAAKLYDSIKAGTYRSRPPIEALHESENLNTYRKTIDAGERVFLKFTTKPKPQVVYALKSRGWHWNGLEKAWSIKPEKYDAEYVASIDERYEKYL